MFIAQRLNNSALFGRAAFVRTLGSPCRSSEQSRREDGLLAINIALLRSGGPEMVLFAF